MQDKRENATRNANLLIRRRPAGGTPANREIGGSKATANREIGVPVPGNPTGIARGWRSRGYLPHLDSANLTQGVTVHLADSLPKEVLEKLQAQIDALPEEEQDRELRKRIEAYVDAGHGCCILREPAIARMVQYAFLFFHGQRYTLRAWVVMPNHIHVLFTPINNWTLNKIVASWKKHTARKICDHWRAHPETAPRSANLAIGRRPTTGIPANREIGVPIGPVWHPEFWDRYIRDQRHLNQSVKYIHRNPVKAGLVALPEDWPWSSARNANLLIRQPTKANREIGVPNTTANREIGVPGAGANREIGVPRSGS